MLIKLNPNQNPIPVDVPTGMIGTDFNVVSVMAAYNAHYGDLVVADASGGQFNVTLPLANSVVAGQSNSIIVKNEGALNNVIVVVQGGNTIDGAGNRTLAPGQSLYIVSNGGSEWISIAGVGSTTLAAAYAGSTSPTDNTLVLTHAKGGLILDETGLNAGDIIFQAGCLLSVKNPNGPWFPGAPGGVDGMFTDFVQITGQLVGVVDASTNYTSYLYLAADNDFHLLLGQSTELEGGDLYLRGGQGSVAGPRNFGGSLRGYSGPQSDTAPPGQNFCGIVIFDTAYHTLDTPGTGYPTPGIVNSAGGATYYDCNLGAIFANSVLIGRTDQSGVNPNTVIRGKNLYGRAAQGGGIQLHTDTDGYGLLVSAGSGDITISGAITVQLTAFGGQAQVLASHFAGAQLIYGAASFTVVPTTAKSTVPLGAPAMTTATRNTLTAGLVASDAGVSIWNTDTSKPNYYNGAGGWVDAAGAPA